MSRFGFFPGSFPLSLTRQLEHGSLDQLQGVADLQFDILSGAVVVIVVAHFIIEEIGLLDLHSYVFVEACLFYSFIKPVLKVSYSTPAAFERTSDKLHPSLSAPWNPHGFPR